MFTTGIFQNFSGKFVGVTYTFCNFFRGLVSRFSTSGSFQMQVGSLVNISALAGILL